MSREGGRRGCRPASTCRQRPSRHASNWSLPSMVKRCVMLDAKRLLGPIIVPPGPEAGQFGAPLPPADPGGVRPFPQPAAAGAEQQVPPQIIEPAEHDGARPTNGARLAGPNRRQSAGLAETALV